MGVTSAAVVPGALPNGGGLVDLDLNEEETISQRVNAMECWLANCINIAKNTTNYALPGPSAAPTKY